MSNRTSKLSRMSNQDKRGLNHREGISHSSREPSLRGDMPENLRKAGPVRRPFDHARDPWLSKQLKAERQTEAQRRESGDGAKMVKLHKPFPELKPKHDLTQIRKTFNKNWMQEAHAARMTQFDEQARHMRDQAENKYQPEHSAPKLEHTR